MRMSLNLSSATIRFSVKLLLSEILRSIETQFIFVCLKIFLSLFLYLSNCQTFDFSLQNFTLTNRNANYGLIAFNSDNTGTNLIKQFIITVCSKTYFLQFYTLDSKRPVATTNCTHLKQKRPCKAPKIDYSELHLNLTI